ncbi:methionyl-tRNA synthetase [Nematocida sp. AWRm77]|nr:methionyl-tRNA synthetase [Nematocida sp. AWRm77]
MLSPGLEPGAFGLLVRCSNQLSYESYTSYTLGGITHSGQKEESRRKREEGRRSQSGNTKKLFCFQMTKNKRLITSALPYVNNLPHLGNIAGSLLSGDVFARYSRLRGYNVLFVCGTDEYGTASEVSADKEGLLPLDLCTRNSAEHKKIYDWFNLKFDTFGRTSCAEHTALVQKLFLEIWENGHCTPQSEERLFCTQCKMFLADRYVNGTCRLCKSDKARGDQCDDCGAILAVEDVLLPRCSACSTPPVKKETTHLFYNLEKFQERVGECIEQNAPNWTPAARQVALEWRGKDLQPRCITRDLKYKWGVPVPLEEYAEKVLYVWFDAPMGYITFSERAGKASWWADSNTDLYEFMGKDNVFFHSVFFPCLLMGTSSVFKYPKIISSTHYLMYEGGKFSKSHGRGIFGHHLLEDKLGPEGVWRFHLMRTRPETGDTDFSWVEFHESLNAILINTIGNLCHRVLSYVSKRMGGVLSRASLPADVVDALNSLLGEYHAHMEATEIRQAMGKITEIAVIGNGYVQKAFAEKASPEVMKAHMSSALNIILLLSRVLYPVTPTEAQALQDILRVSGDPVIPDTFTEELQEGHAIGTPSLLFKPLTDAQILEVQKLCIKECPFSLQK